ncbi:exopolysaccharide biosynthesis polyprenyl glycosylphosphotransferase [Modestobacter sp. DSM 44400]|uniref:sugar transferase n=1 Tax=Modestobacter sp. DSM 44400 TaxID=1550230 RepID=UPI00089B207F|nr:sugar transferase [Modestobacter sp. DSM 44400]SDX86413.1 exopolysaccharide biosynthesis polyprenyl glycosylphosphotransferase [Modestobacter sp. DSM 44400]
MALAEERWFTGHPGSSGTVLGSPTGLWAPSGDALVPELRAGHRGRRRWLVRYRRSVLALDLAIACVVGLVTVLVPLTNGPFGEQRQEWLGVLVPLLWLALAGLRNAYDPRVFGSGSEEYRRVAAVGVLMLATVAFVSYALDLDLPRTLVVFCLPALTAAVLVGRYVARKTLHRARSAGRCLKRVVAVGREGAVLELVEHLNRERYAGMLVVGACVPDPETADRLVRAGVPVAGSLDDVAEVVRQMDADTVAVTSASETAALYLRRLTWQLEGSGVEVLVSPGLIEVAGPRLHIRPFVGLPLLSVEEPEFSGWRRLVKGSIDRVAAAVLLVVAFPVLAGIALAVRLSGPGPVLYRQERVGLGGRLYTMYKFRSMVVDAEARLAALQTANEGEGLLFKLRHDPRVTPVGRWLRRFSLDELPQLLNVLGGAMSLVGPRPPLPTEVERYDSSVRRRLLVRPGLTGLWQISGRSDLSWEDSVRLDLRYVENWSLALDVLILWKTAATVLGSRGAY